MALSTLSTVYSDQLFSATDLNRQSGRILDLALSHPITITRNEESFALLRRDDVECLVKMASVTKTVFEAINVAYQLRLSQRINSGNPYGWLAVFDADELSDFIDEITNALLFAGGKANDWDDVEAILHEWHESAIAISSSVHAAAFNDLNDEVALSKP